MLGQKVETNKKVNKVVKHYCKERERKGKAMPQKCEFELDLVHKIVSTSTKVGKDGCC